MCRRVGEINEFQTFVFFFIAMYCALTLCVRVRDSSLRRCLLLSCHQSPLGYVAALSCICQPTKFGIVGKAMRSTLDELPQCCDERNLATFS